MFITFEGIEGCGKSTQARLLLERLEKRVRVILTSEPGGTGIGDQIRAILLDSSNKGMEALAELFLYEADRAQHVREVIKPALAKGWWVLCDRFCDATLAYQGFARGQDMELIRFLNEKASYGLKPDLTVLLDCPVEIGLQRALKRDKLNFMEHRARFEQEPEEFHQAVREGYLKLAETEPDRFLVLDGSLDKDTLARRVFEAVEPYLPLRNTGPES